MKKLTALLLALALVLCSFAGCDQLSDPDPTGGVSPGGDSAPAETVDFAQSDADMFTDRDSNPTYSGGTVITLNGSSATVSGTGAAVSGSTVTVSAPGTYVISGSLDDGMIVVNAAGSGDKVQLVLSGVDIYSSTGAAICVLDADKVFLTLADGSTNTLAVGETLGTVSGYEMDAAIYSRSDLTVNGSGALEITSPAGHGITCKDDLAVTSGSIRVTCANQAIDANDSIRIRGGTFTLDAGKDGIHAENADDASLGFIYISGGVFDIECEGDGISAGNFLQIVDGSITVLAGGGYENGSSASSDGWGGMDGMGGRPRSGTASSGTSTEAQSMKGLKAAAGILLSGGTFNLDTADDSVHSDVNVTVNGGSYTIASGDDAFHAEDTLTVTACDVTVSEAYEGLEAEKIYVKGGTLWMNCSDDGLNASGGADSSGNGGRDEMFGGRPGGMGGTNADAIIDISGGHMTIYSCGDGLDSNGNLTMSGGYVYVTNPRSGDVSVLDSQNQPVITGGTYIGLGISTMMAETFSSSSTQGTLALSCGLSAGTQISFSDADGNVILSVTTEYSTQIIIVSCPEMVKGETYTVTAGTISQSFKAN